MPVTWNINRFLAFILLILPFSSASQEQNHNAWKLEKDKNGIRVYSRHLTDSKLKEVKVTCELNAGLSQLAAFVSDIDHYKEAVYRVAEAHLVKRVSDREFYYYSETEMVWPVSNRDLVIHMEFEMDRATRTLRIHGTNAPEMAPPKKGIVRIPHWRSLWTVQELDGKRLQVDYTFAVDPGGELPIWLVNALIAVGPYQSFANMQKVISRPYYQNRTFSFL
ncbi:START domain-containing protein [Runella slithyformis]|uniref:START domain-containing protein n=1 Tax=Runella slithyformis (strain ATCC 29530 / DSM 19594 / LMG 11500 / NCIMB 11436 / LSU 4) TaxID=761193 RepID=A0A7U3ZMP8_RUNSL|nr:START domain-containing protein [Runella slithyformis]AEI50050.1 hypothetical protein Runsl_3692 [Runella slithyformis DSM 19594]